MKTTWARSEILGKRLLWLVDITFAGRAIRLSTEHVVVPSDDGDLAYDGTCEGITVTEEMPLLELAASPLSVTLNAVWPVDVAALVAKGHDLTGARATLSQWVVGTDYEDRRVVLIGRLADPEYGQEGYVSCSIEENLFEDSSLIPPADQTVSETNFTGLETRTVGVLMGPGTLGNEDVGLPYPVVIGRPGRDPQNYSGWQTGSAGCWVDKASFHHALLLSYGHVDATQVWANNDDFVQGLPFNVTTGFDDANVPVTYLSDDGGNGSYTTGFEGIGQPSGPANVDVSFNPTPDTNTVIYIGWRDGGGVKGRKGTAVRGAGDVLEYVLDYATAPLDRGRFAAAAPMLNHFRIDAVIDDHTSPWEWVQEMVLPLLPVSIVSGPDGYYPIVWRSDATAADSVAHLDADNDSRIEVSETISIDNSTILNDFTLRYGRSRRTGTYTYAARLGAEHVEATNKARCRFVRQAGVAATDHLYVSALTAGPSRVGMRVYLDNTGAIPPNVVDSVTTHTVQMTYATSDASATTQALADEFQTSTLVTAAESADTTPWAAASIEDADQTLDLVDNGTMPSLLCRISQERLRQYRADGSLIEGSGLFPEEIEASVIWDKATAYAILHWRAAAFALARRRLSMLVPEGEWGWLARGDVVTVSYDPLGLEDQVALIEAIEWSSDGTLGLRLVLVEDPARDPLG